MGEVERFDVAVVGAGLAGLMAARKLAAEGRRVCVLEARDRVGGRTLNEPVLPGTSGDREVVVEIGGQWFAPQHRRSLALIEELGLETFPTYAAGENLFERRGQITRYRGSIPMVNPLALAETGLMIARLNRMAKRVNPVAPWLAAGAERWDSETFATWLRRNARFGVTRDLMRLASQAVWAAEPEDLSMLHLLFYISAAGTLDALIDTEGGAQDRRLVGGSQLISLRLADQLGDAVRLNSPVRSVRHGDLAAGAVELSTDSDTVRADHAVFAMSPTLTGRINFDPPLPASRDGLSQRMAQGNVVKCMAVYEEPFWREQGLSGQATSADGPISVTFDNSPPEVGGQAPFSGAEAGSGGEVGPGVLLAFLEGRAARAACDLPQPERRGIVLGCLTRLFGPKAAAPIQYLDKPWANDPWSAGCYGGFLPTGAWIANGPALRAPVGALHWAGAETATSWAGYMEGAIASGERAAAEILATGK